MSHILSFEVGSVFQERLVISADQVKQFAQLSGDNNPIHLSDDAARASGFKAAIVHGMLAGSFFSNILGTRFPGEGTIYLGQNLQFKAPIYVGEELKIMLKVTGQKPGKPIYFLSTQIFNADETELKVEGEAVIKAPNTRVSA